MISSRYKTIKSVDRLFLRRGSLKSALITKDCLTSVSQGSSSQALRNCWSHMFKRTQLLHKLMAEVVVISTLLILQAYRIQKFLCSIPPRFLRKAMQYILGLYFYEEPPRGGYCILEREGTRMSVKESCRK